MLALVLLAPSSQFTLRGSCKTYAATAGCFYKAALIDDIELSPDGMHLLALKSDGKIPPKVFAHLGSD